MTNQIQKIVQNIYAGRRSESVLIHFLREELKSESYLIHSRTSPKCGPRGGGGESPHRTRIARSPTKPPFGTFVGLWGGIAVQLTTRE